MGLQIRYATATDNLGPFFGEQVSPLAWNPAQVVVAVDGETLVGMVLVFDGGHPVVMVEYARVLPPWEGKGVWAHLMRWLRQQLEAQGKVAMFGYAPVGPVTGMAVRGGGKIDPMTYRALRWEFV